MGTMPEVTRGGEEVGFSKKHCKVINQIWGLTVVNSSYQ